MQDKVYSLIEDLRRISPIPDDDSNDQTSVILDTYDMIINQLDEMIKENPSLVDYVSPKAIIDSFGYGVAYGV